jgi:hypothetical protein
MLSTLSTAAVRVTTAATLAAALVLIFAPAAEWVTTLAMIPVTVVSYGVLTYLWSDE